jgi:hypothetical protein
VRILTTANHLDSTGGLERTHLTNAQGLAHRGHRLDLVYVGEGHAPTAGDAAEERLSRNDEVDLIEGAKLSALERRRA